MIFPVPKSNTIQTGKVHQGLTHINKENGKPMDRLGSSFNFRDWVPAVNIVTLWSEMGKNCVLSQRPRLGEMSAWRWLGFFSPALEAYTVKWQVQCRRHGVLRTLVEHSGFAHLLLWETKLLPYLSITNSAVEGARRRTKNPGALLSPGGSVPLGVYSQSKHWCQARLSSRHLWLLGSGHWVRGTAHSPVIEDWCTGANVV